MSVSTVRGVLDDCAVSTDHHWASANYQSVVVALAQRLGLHVLCEIGGGRQPLFTPEAADGLGLRLIVNDISEAELRRGPKEFEKVCFDIGGPVQDVPLDPGSIDLVFSRMVFEHVRDVRAAWRNTFALLRKGGVGLAFIPTLYSPPFLVNRLIPEGLSERILVRLNPDRRGTKFPAYYDHCFGDDRKQRHMLEQLGFREIEVMPFWGHGYLERVPILRELDGAINRTARSRGWRALTSFAYVIARK